MTLSHGSLGLALGCTLLVAGCDGSTGTDAASAGSGATSGSTTGGATNSGGTVGVAGAMSGTGGTSTTGGTNGTGGGGGTGGAMSGGAAGTSTTGGASGESGSGGTAGVGGSEGGASGVGGTSGAAGTGDCIDFSHIEKGSRDLRVIGTGFDEPDGETVRVVVTTGAPRNAPDYGLVETKIRSGSFDITLPDAVAEYWGIGVYIDTAKDDACAVDEDPFWEMTTGADQNDVTFAITPSLPPNPNGRPCYINGSVFNLTQALRCSD